MRQALSPDTVVGEYRVVEFIGAGGMGEVYRAVHSKIGRVAAVKVLTQAGGGDEGLLERFFNEARIQASLQHPNVAALYDFVELDGQPCIIMEYVDGQSLCDRVRPSGPLPLAEVVYVFQSVVEAVAYIHNHGVVHRDIKSNNIRISSAGQVKLLDFGIAKSETSTRMTATGSVIGTLEYIAPEQLMGGTADARSDIWALGVLLYEMVTGRVPFEALTIGEMCKRIERVEYTPASVLNPAVPREVTAIISRCLRKNPMDRYRLAQDLLEDTKRLRALVSTPGLTHVGSGASTPSPLRLPSVSLPRVNWKVLSAVGGGALALLVVALGVYFAAGALSGPGAGVAAPQSAGLTSNRPGGGGQARTVTIDAVGGKAEVFRDGRLVGQTPCPVEAAIGDTVNLLLKREGFEDYRDSFVVTAQTRSKTYPMQRKARGASDQSN